MHCKHLSILSCKNITQLIQMIFFNFSGKAGPPSFKSEPEGLEEQIFALEWVSESITPITTFKVEYKPDHHGSWYSTNLITDEESKDEGWIEIMVTPKHTEDHFFTGKHVIQGLQPQTRYVARVSSKNHYGFSKPTHFVFGTKGAGKCFIHKMV